MALYPGLPGWASTRKVYLNFTKARDSEWQWYQLGRMKVCTSLQTDNHASTPPFSFFYRPDALSATQPTLSKHWKHGIKYRIQINLLQTEADWSNQHVSVDTLLLLACYVLGEHVGVPPPPLTTVTMAFTGKISKARKAKQTQSFCLYQDKPGGIYLGERSD